MSVRDRKKLRECGKQKINEGQYLKEGDDTNR